MQSLPVLKITDGFGTYCSSPSIATSHSRRLTLVDFDHPQFFDIGGGPQDARLGADGEILIFAK